jgi:hypothetical protein
VELHHDIYTFQVVEICVNRCQTRDVMILAIVVSIYFVKSNICRRVQRQPQLLASFDVLIPIKQVVIPQH